jgi:NAD(P)-dependent dehydrogenase (short-subunit alcohol dehydrogenase family)
LKRPQKMVALVTGCSSGIGYSASLMFARNGFHTYASMRNMRKSTIIQQIANREALPLEVIQLNVNNSLSVKNAIEDIISEKGRIDVLVNNAGYGLMGPIEDISIEELKAQFETNLFGVFRVIQQVLPTMRRQKEGGRIINVSSIGGILGYPFSSAYCSTKCALEGLSESMSYEVEPFDIKVILIEPAFVISDFHNNAKIVVRTNKTDNSPSYTQTMNRMFEKYKQVVEEYKTSAEEVAKVILNAALSANPEQRYLVGRYSETMMREKRTMSDAQSHNMMKSQLLGNK